MCPHHAVVNKNIKVTREDHLDLFDKDRLVYLSPDSRNDLKRVGMSIMHTFAHICCTFSVLVQLPFT